MESVVVEEIKEVELRSRRAQVVMGVTLGSTNQKATFRSRGTNGPISVQQEVT